MECNRSVARIAWGMILALVLLPLAPASAQTVSADLDDLAALQSRFQSVADRVAPAVVAISASTTPDISPAALRSEEMNPQKLDAFLAKTTRIIGTGCIISADGYILTNDHVIDDAQQLWITTDDKKVYPALVIGTDPRADLAVLKIPAHNLSAVHFGDASHLKRGQWSIAIGNPLGLSGQGQMSLSVGVISATNRSLQKLSDRENRLYLNLIQTTAQINPGNSGGPLFDLSGDVIGVNTAVIMPQKATNGIGFALPIDSHLLSIVRDLKQGKEIVYAYLGVVVDSPTERQWREAHLAEGVGARVDSVEPNSPAVGQLDVDDLILAINSQTISDENSFVQVVGSAPVTRPVQIDLVRDGRRMNITVALGKRPMPVAAVTRDNQRLRWGGMLLGPLPPDYSGGASAGVMVFSIDPASPFTKLGLQPGTVIRSVAGKAVTDMTQLQGIINDVPLERCDIAVADNPPLDNDAAHTANAMLPMEH
jgi:serine protease Do